MSRFVVALPGLARPAARGAREEWPSSAEANGRAGGFLCCAVNYKRAATYHHMHVDLKKREGPSTAYGTALRPSTQPSRSAPSPDQPSISPRSAPPVPPSTPSAPNPLNPHRRHAGPLHCGITAGCNRRRGLGAKSASPRPDSPRCSSPPSPLGSEETAPAWNSTSKPPQGSRSTLLDAAESIGQVLHERLAACALFTTCGDREHHVERAGGWGRR